MSGRRWAAALAAILTGAPLVLSTAVPVTAAAPSFTRFAGNWAGYAASGASFTTISGSWIEPNVTCTGSALYAPWIGIDGYNDSTVEQTGVQTKCSGGTPVASGWYEMYPAAPVYYSNPVSLGDHITAKVVYQGAGNYALTLKDVTKGWSHTVSKHLSAQNASAEAIIEAPGGFPTIPNGVTFTNVLVNGAKLSTFHPAKLTATGGWVPGPLTGGTFTIKHT